MIKPTLTTLRPHQWVKNILVFAPLIMAHRYGDTAALLSGALAFAAFCCLASGVYIINDLWDARADRAHPRKSRRPIASGAVSVNLATGFAVGLTTAGLLIATAVNIAFLKMAALYLLLALLYCVSLRRLRLIDVFGLSLFYTLRVYAGAEATATPVSYWFLAFAVFLFLHLACLKRYLELGIGGIDSAVSARGYTDKDAVNFKILGMTCGCLAVLVLILYINSPQVTVLYARPQFLWFIAPILLFWTVRGWFMADAGGLSDDPVALFLSDIPSYVMAAVCALILVLAQIPATAAP